jgi:hypothetical protein
MTTKRWPEITSLPMDRLALRAGIGRRRIGTKRFDERLRLGAPGTQPVIGCRTSGRGYGWLPVAS